MKNPEKVLFLRYEDLQSDCVGCVARIGRFLGCPAEVIDRSASAIVEKCSFKSLANSQINKSGCRKDSAPTELRNSMYFREGKSGGWKNYFTAKMEYRMRNDVGRKLEDEGISFHY
eukprot:TRINITY_DN33103_c0_g1_i1.p2 TRINITY_DN33103_c0_g1~~TRINITY_DN33103_c0_g1_i1.p2  ORF type:complete len:116 (+),score=6.28 TRINITY_DN33103_c0_g1_i1:673-1020(+)